MVLLGEADGRAGHVHGPGVGGHDEHHVAEIGLAPVVVSERPVVHDLQQQVEDLRVGLFNFVEQHDTVWMLGDRLGEQAALVESDVTRRRADQARDRVPLHVFGHVVAQQLDAGDERQLAAHLGLAHPGRAGKEEGADRLVAGLEPGAGQLDAVGELVDRLVLAENDHLELLIEAFERFLVGGGNLGGGNAGDLGHHLLHVAGADGLFAAARRQQLLCGARLVDDVDGLVGHEAIGDVLGGQLRCGAQRRVGEAQLVVVFKARLQALEDLVGVLNVRLDDVDLLKAP